MTTARRNNYQENPGHARSMGAVIKKVARLKGVQPSEVSTEDIALYAAWSSSAESLNILAAHEDETVRYAVAHNYDTPQAVLFQLARDRDELVRAGVVRNEALSPALIAVLRADPSPYVRHLLAEYVGYYLSRTQAGVR